MTTNGSPLAPVLTIRVADPTEQTASRPMRSLQYTILHLRSVGWYALEEAAAQHSAYVFLIHNSSYIT